MGGQRACRCAQKCRSRGLRAGFSTFLLLHLTGRRQPGCRGARQACQAEPVSGLQTALSQVSPCRPRCRPCSVRIVPGRKSRGEMSQACPGFSGALLANGSPGRKATKKTKRTKQMRSRASSHLSVGTVATSTTGADAQRTLNHKMAKRPRQPNHQLRTRPLPRPSRAGLSKRRLTISTIIRVSVRERRGALQSGQPERGGGDSFESGLPRDSGRKL